MKISLLIVFLISALSASLKVEPLEFSLIKKGDSKDGNTILIIGGIQGDEPGGFMAASLISTRYKIKNGNVWIVPNLNFDSIINRSRGRFGDMNRKFATLSKNDPEYETVQKIKSIILDKKIDFVLNLHDGSGFYRKKYIDKLHNQHRWGQSCIIDQNKIDKNVKFYDLKTIAERVVKSVNQKSQKKEFNFRLHNTETREKDPEMAKTLTYFAITNGKPAFGIESSKNFPTHMRVFYQLLALEEFMKVADIEFTKDFDLTPKAVKLALNTDLYLEFDDNRILLSLDGIKKFLKYFPLPNDREIVFKSNNPLITIKKLGNNYQVYYGNRRLTKIIPQYLSYSNTIKDIKVKIDNNSQNISLGSIVDVEHSFNVENKNGYRANIIGYIGENRNEMETLISKKDIIKKYSVDKKGNIYRVELYKNNSFVGMILVNFTGSKKKLRIATSLNNNKKVEI